MSSYAQWEDGWAQQPPQPPERPTVEQWRRLSELDRMAYDGAVTGYIMAFSTPRQWDYWTRLRLDLLEERLGGAMDGAPSKRRPWRPW